MLKGEKNKNHICSIYTNLITIMRKFNAIEIHFAQLFNCFVCVFLFLPRQRDGEKIDKESKLPREKSQHQRHDYLSQTKKFKPLHLS